MKSESNAVDKLRLATFERVDEIPMEEIPGILVKLAGLQATLLARIITIFLNGARQIQPDPDQLLTIAQVAELLGVPKAYAYELARRGELPKIRVGPKYIRVRLSEVKPWLDGHSEKKLDRVLDSKYDSLRLRRHQDRARVKNDTKTPKAE